MKNIKKKYLDKMFHVKHNGDNIMKYSYRALEAKIMLNSQIEYIKEDHTNLEKYNRYVTVLEIINTKHYLGAISIKTKEYMELKALNAYISSID